MIEANIFPIGSFRSIWRLSKHIPGKFARGTSKGQQHALRRAPSTPTTVWLVGGGSMRTPLDLTAPVEMEEKLYAIIRGIIIMVFQVEVPRGWPRDRIS